jgi:7-cyano-7-deazaguanine reductase
VLNFEQRFNDVLRNLQVYEMNDGETADSADRLKALQQEALEHTEASLKHMERFGVKPEGKVGLFLPPDQRKKDLQRLPYDHDTRQVVTYETEPGEFSALCPFSGLPDFGVLRVEYVPGDWIIELKSLKYYILSWRNIGAAQEDITSIIYEDLIDHLENPGYLKVTTTYNVRGGIETICTVDSREQAGG